MIKKRITPDIKIEQQIISGMMISTKFIKEIKHIYNKDSLKLSYAKILAQWCMEYYDNFKASPGIHIKEVYASHYEQDIIEEHELKTINKFIRKVLKKYKAKEDFNVNFYLDKSEKHFRMQSLVKIKDSLDEEIINGSIDMAEGIIKNYKRVTRPETVGINLITDEQIIIDSFDKRDEDVLFRLKGALGDIIGNFEREQLIAVVAPTKVGKSWYLQEIALKALTQGLKVLFVSFEMTPKQMTHRIHMNLNALPMFTNEIGIPVFDCKHNQSNECRKGCEYGLDPDIVMPPAGWIRPSMKHKYDPLPKRYEPCTLCRGTAAYEVATYLKIKIKEGLTKKKIFMKQKSLKIYSRMKGDKFRFMRFPSKSINMNDLKTYVYNLEQYENFMPDLIVTDYADKIAPEDKRLQKLDSELEIWDAHKAMAQEFHCAIATANQSNTVRTGKNVGQGDWAGNIQKQAIIDTGFCLNQTPEEKLKGIVRAATLVKRDDDFDVNQEVLVLQCYRIGQACLDSYAL